MSFTVQSKQMNGRWAPVAFNRRHATLDAAVARCCGCDEDGMFPSDLRVVDEDGKVLVTAKSWRDEFRGGVGA